MSTEQSRGLHKIAEELDERYAGFRVEILGGRIVMSPSPSHKHARILTDLLVQIAAGISDEYVVEQGSGVNAPMLGEEYAIPDLSVYTADVQDPDSDAWEALPDQTPLVVEVVSKSNARSDTVFKLGWYAEAGVPAYLLIDPRDATWRLHTEPEGTSYGHVVEGRFGEPVKLPAPIDLEVSTSKFLPYKTR